MLRREPTDQAKPDLHALSLFHPPSSQRFAFRAQM
jgi:hypothetical protein